MNVNNSIATVIAPSVITDYLAQLLPSEKRYLERIGNRTARWKPQSKPQWLAFLSRADELFYGGAGGGGKALALDTPIPTPRGWSMICDLHVGDSLFDERGQPCTVVAISPIMANQKVYAVEFDDGSVIKADAGHQWLTLTRSERGANHRRSHAYRTTRKANRQRRGTGKRPDLALRNSQQEYELLPQTNGALVTTDEILSTIKTRKGESNHAIAVATPLQLPDPGLPIPPYTLGAWLGDGHSQGAGFTTADLQILDEITADGFEISKRSGKYEYGILGLQARLRACGLINNKHIPEMYLRASELLRRDLLAGLMDTDGTCLPSGASEFYTTNRRLAYEVRELIVSLGIKCAVGVGRAMLNGKDCGDKYRIKFTTSTPVFRLKRKLERQVKIERGTQRLRYVVDVREIPSEPVRCIEVDSPSHLYLAGESMIPTHNSDLLLGLAGEAHQKSIIFRRVFPNLRELIERSRQLYGSPDNDHRKDSFNESLHVWRFEDERMLEFGSMQYEKDKNNFQGRPHDFIGIDEAPQFSETQVIFVSAWNRSVDPEQRVRLILTGNPPMDDEGRWIVRRYAPWLKRDHHHPAKSGELRWYAVLDGKETEVESGGAFMHKGEMVYPRSRTFIRAMLDDNPFYANDGGRYKSVLQSLPDRERAMMLYGDFEASDPPHPMQVINSDWVRAAQRRWLERQPPTTPLTAVGIDCSRGGDDKTTLAKRYDNWFAPVRSWPGKVIKDGAILAENARQEIGEEEPGYINIDVSGIGTSGYDHVKPMYENVVPFNPAEGSTYRDKSKKLKMRNKRAEMYWRFRDALDPKDGDDIALPPSTELIADLCSARYKVSSAGVQIEDKEEIIARIGRSPDEGEAVMMAHFPQSQKGWTRTVA